MSVGAGSVREVLNGGVDTVWEGEPHVGTSLCVRVPRSVCLWARVSVCTHFLGRWKQITTCRWFEIMGMCSHTVPGTSCLNKVLSGGQGSACPKPMKPEAIAQCPKVQGSLLTGLLLGWGWGSLADSCPASCTLSSLTSWFL